MKRFLRLEDVIPDTADKDGRTPLSWAARKGYAHVVKILLEREDLTPDNADKDGRTPLSWAAQKGHRGVVKMLLGREDVTPDTADNDGRTPLSWAEECGHIQIVDMLQGKCSVNQNMVMADPIGQTARIGTSEKQPKGLVKRLLHDQGPVSRSVSCNNSIGLFLAEPSESTQQPSKRIRRT